MKENGKVNPITTKFEYESEFNNNYKKYKYIGKVNVEGKEYTKISFISTNNIDKEYYYIDILNRVVSKKEYYSNYGNGFELKAIYNYTYSYNTVVDEDIKKFDLNNYSDYKYIEEEKE